MEGSDFKPGLEGVVAFETEIAEPDKEGNALRYRGVDIEELVGHVPYEKVWGLLVDDSFDPGMPRAENVDLPAKTGSAMADLQSATAALAGQWGLKQLIDMTDTEARDDLARLSATMISIVAQSARGPDRVVRRDRLEGDTAAERFLLRWRGEADPHHVRAIDSYWVSAAEHGANASTFTGRIVASTGADCAAAMSAAVGALSGPLHGGAPTRVLKMLDEVADTDDVRSTCAIFSTAASASWASATASTAPRTRGHASCGEPRASSSRRASRSPRHSSRPLSRSWPRAIRTASWPRTSSSGRRSCSTSPTSRRRSSPRSLHARGLPAGLRTSSSRCAPAA